MGINYKNQVWELQDYVLPKEVLDSSKKKQESKSEQKEDKSVKVVDKVKKNANSWYIMQRKNLIRKEVDYDKKDKCIFTR